jgi:hypothetical protein
MLLLLSQLLKQKLLLLLVELLPKVLHSRI